MNENRLLGNETLLPRSRARAHNDHAAPGKHRDRRVLLAGLLTAIAVAVGRRLVESIRQLPMRRPSD